MCLIIIKKQASLDVDLITLFNASERNSDGLGVIWLDDFSLQRLGSHEYHLLDVERPYAAIFRKASSGGDYSYNNQPIQVDEHRYLMMNGTIPHLGSLQESDAYKLAAFVRHSKTEEQVSRLFATYKHCRFALINTKEKSVSQYNDAWVTEGGVSFSNNIDFAY